MNKYVFSYLQMTETKLKKHGEKFVFACRKTSKLQVMLKENAFVEYCHNLLNRADWSSHKLMFSFSLILCTLLFIFLTSARKQLRHLLENNQLLYSLHCSLSPTYWLSIRYIFKSSHCQSVSLENKIVQNYTGLNNVHCKVWTDIKRSLENSPFIAQNSKSTFYVPSCSAQAVVVHSFLTLRLDPPKGRSIFLCSANPSSPTKKYGTFGPSVPETVCHWVIPAYLSELMSIA